MSSQSTSGKTDRLQGQTNRSIRVESSRIVDIFYPPPRLACRVLTKCLANRLPVRRVDCKANESIDSSRFESNRRLFLPSLKAGLPCFYKVSSQSTSGKTDRLQGQTNRSIRVKSSRIVDIFYPSSRLAYRVLAKCLANRLPVRRIDYKGKRIDRFESNRHNPRRIESDWVYWTTLRCLGSNRTRGSGGN